MNRKRATVGALVLIASAALWWSRPSDSSAAPPSRAVSSTRATPAAQPARPVAPKADAKRGVARRAAAGPVYAASWGSGADQLGRERPDEGNPLGPMSFTTDAKGRLLVLDGVNGRLVRRGADGSPDTLIDIDVINPEDIAVGEDGSIAVLDRFRDKSVALFDESGRPLGKLPLEGDGVPDVGSITSITVDGGDVYAEREHGPLVKLGSLSGQPAADRTEIPGRPSRDGLSFLNAGIIEAPAGRAYVSSVERATGNHRYTRELRLEAPLRQIHLLDTDQAGTVYFGAELERSETETSLIVVCLEALSGLPMGSVAVPANTLAEESFRDFVVLPGGGVLHALRTEQGVSYTRYDCE